MGYGEKVKKWFFDEEGDEYDVADESYDAAYGARPVKRFLQRNMETELAGEIIRGNVKDGDKVIIDSDGNKLIFNV